MFATLVTLQQPVTLLRFLFGTLNSGEYQFRAWRLFATLYATLCGPNNSYYWLLQQKLACGSRFFWEDALVLISFYSRLEKQTSIETATSALLVKGPHRLLLNMSHDLTFPDKSRSQKHFKIAFFVVSSSDFWPLNIKWSAIVHISNEQLVESHLTM